MGKRRKRSWSLPGLNPQHVFDKVIVSDEHNFSWLWGKDKKEIKKRKMITFIDISNSWSNFSFLYFFLFFIIFPLFLNSLYHKLQVHVYDISKRNEKRKKREIMTIFIFFYTTDQLFHFLPFFILYSYIWQVIGTCLQYISHEYFSVSTSINSNLTCKKLKLSKEKWDAEREDSVLIVSLTLIFSPYPVFLFYTS